MTARILTLLVVGTAGVGLTGCGGTPQPSGVGMPTVTVDMNDQLRFMPEHLTIPEGTAAIKLVNVGSVPHNLDIPALHIASVTVDGGQTATMIVHATKPGAYSFDCDFHIMDGMVGTLVVRQRSSGHAPPKAADS